MDHKAAFKNAIKYQIKAGYFEALAQGISPTEYRQAVNDALDELEEPKPKPAVSPDTIVLPPPGPFEEPREIKPGHDPDIFPIGPSE